MVHILQTREGCWWFGQPGQCVQLKRLAGAEAVCAIADVLVSIVFSLLVETKSLNTRAYRYAKPDMHSANDHELEYMVQIDPRILTPAHMVA